MSDIAHNASGGQTVPGRIRSAADSWRPAPAGDYLRPALQALSLTALMFLALPYVHLIVPPSPPATELMTIPRTLFPAPPSLPPPPPAETMPDPPPALTPVMPAPVVKAAPLEPVLDFDFSIGGSVGDFALVFSADAFHMVAGAASLFELGDVDQVPQAISQMRPFYPAHARRRRIEGEVTVLFTVTPQGRADGIQVLSSVPDDVFTAAAVRAVERWRFTPALKDGGAVPVRVRQVIRFRMED